MMTKYLALTVIILTILFSKPSFALGKLGHQLVCQLAFEHLPEKQQNKITDLLSTIPDQHKKLINHFNNQKDNSTITFARACTWADTIRHLKDFKSYNAWHYMNVPRSQSKVNTNECQQNCLPQAILQHQQTLAQAQSPYTWQQAQTLLFLGHWLGDIHQPLHISFKDDLGGNKIAFADTEAKCNNLHGYWDHCILYKGKESETKWLTSLRSQWSQSPQPNWQKEQVWQWADESFQITTKSTFNYCHKDNQSVCQKPQGKITLPPDYLTQYQPVIAQRLLQAAQRLTNVLAASL